MLVRHAQGLVAFEVADTHPLALAVTRRTQEAAFAAALGKYPQYDGWCDGAALVRVARNITTKGGPAFTAGQVVLAKPAAALPDVGLAAGYTVYSPQRGGHVRLGLGDCEVVA